MSYYTLTEESGRILKEPATVYAPNLPRVGEFICLPQGTLRVFSVTHPLLAVDPKDRTFSGPVKFHAAYDYEEQGIYPIVLCHIV